MRMIYKCSAVNCMLIGLTDAATAAGITGVMEFKGNLTGLNLLMSSDHMVQISNIVFH